MYLAEVLNKLPVIQHFLFGSILAYDGPLTPTVDTNSGGEHWGHAHTLPNGGREMGWGDCCGIPVPSAFAAAGQEKQKQPGLRLGGPGIRPVPFD